MLTSYDASETLCHVLVIATFRHDHGRLDVDCLEAVSLGRRQIPGQPIQVQDRRLSRPPMGALVRGLAFGQLPQEDVAFGQRQGISKFDCR